MAGERAAFKAFVAAELLAVKETVEDSNATIEDGVGTDATTVKATVTSELGDLSTSIETALAAIQASAINEMELALISQEGPGIAGNNFRRNIILVIAGHLSDLQGQAVTADAAIDADVDTLVSNLDGMVTTADGAVDTATAAAQAEIDDEVDIHVTET